MVVPEFVRGVVFAVGSAEVSVSDFSTFLKTCAPEVSPALGSLNVRF